MTTSVALAEQMLHEERVKADRLMRGLLLAFFPAALGLAAVHGEWIVAIVAGALLSGGAWFVCATRPGTLASCLTVAGTLMGYAALFIQETHGMTEMHFAIFAELAFLTVYRDWRAPVFGAAVIAVHHAVFHALQLAGTGIYVFDMPMHGLSGWGMVALHAGFVIVEVAVLVHIALSLEAETRRQAELMTVQDAQQRELTALAESLEARDLSVGFVSHSSDVTGAVGTLRQGIGQVAELVRSISRTAATVASASEQMAATTAESGLASSKVAASLTQVADGAHRQVAAVDSARTSAAQVTDAAAASAESAALASAATTRVRTTAEEGAAAAAEATAAAQAVSNFSVQATEAIVELATKSEQIDAIVDTITRIAEQTNLLALNAAIEAARAGESGMGFAVVAEEVRKLAEESQHAASTISRIVQEIQTDTRRAVEVVRESASRAGESASTAQQTREAFERIAGAVQEWTEQSEQITRSTRFISEGADQMRREMESVLAVAEQSSAATEHASAATQETSASSEEVAASADVLRNSARELQAMVETFRLGG